MIKKRAFIISFEGIEGTGKSTQCRLLSAYLRRRGLDVAVFREPGTSVAGEQIRRILLHGKGKLTLLAETLLFLAARAQLKAEKIAPQLRKRDVIILDRYIDATLAYQGYGSGVDLALIKEINSAAVGDCVPDSTILLDIAPKIGLSRCAGNDRIEKRKLSFHKKVRKGYLCLARENAKRIKLIPVKSDINVIQTKIQEIIDNELNRRKRQRF
ncbi:MAG: dTMP kinase [Candidatus Omnitrophica bacterium]|nr:dTMP kinase [Candidatus Omnitrophota bacterium]MBU4479383.1 dTMP kinase [Candidatus Omnitrophota bacterium]MCG2703235.1 dTMP kinase [Candidatus Omnitrophota bacterium]